MANLEELLKKVSEIVVREKTQQEEKRRRGENFNIFKVLGLSTSEVRLHSAFLAELLNPNGDHGLGNTFMKAFLDDVIKKQVNFSFDSSSAKVYVEYDIGKVSTDYKEGGRIDLLIHDKNGQTIIIENKIYAGDQPLQLYRYNDYADKHFRGKYILLYLTLDSHLPDKSSIGKESTIEYICVSYKEDIIEWLNHCICIAALCPRIRETIVQYVTNINQIMNIMSENNKKELIELLKSNMSAAIGILEVEGEIRKEVRRNFILFVLQKIAVRNGFSITNCNEDFLNCKKDSVLTFTDNQTATTKGAFVLKMYRSSDVYYGIEFSDQKYINIKGEKLWHHYNNMFPFGHGWIDDGKQNCYWDRNSTIIQMQKEIELIQMQKENEYCNYDFADTIIAKEIDNQLKYVREKDMLNELEKMLI